jgi:hypothetical protein
VGADFVKRHNVDIAGTLVPNLMAAEQRYVFQRTRHATFAFIFDVEESHNLKTSWKHNCNACDLAKTMTVLTANLHSLQQEFGNMVTTIMERQYEQ